MALQQKIIALKGPGQKLVLQSYVVDKVVDDRADTLSVGALRAGLGKALVSLNFEEGATAAVTGYIQRFVVQDMQKEKVVLHLKKWEVSERMEKGKRVAELSSVLAFYKDGDKVMEYTGSAYVSALLDVGSHVGGLFDKNLEAALKEFDTWWQNNRAIYNNAYLTDITAEARLSTVAKDKTKIAFDRSVPLRMEDFQAEPDPLSRAAALTYSGFYMEAQSQTMGSKTKVKISVLPYFDRRRSWIRPEARNNYVLAHEQLHFDITALVTSQFVKTINSYTFSPTNYQEELAELQRRYEKELEALQEQYDKETKHGLLKDKQAIWEDKIKQQLRETE